MLRTYVLTVTDSSGRTASTETLNITTSNPQPTVQLTVGVGVTAEQFSIASIAMYHPGASGIKSVCFQINNSQCISGSLISSGNSTTKYGFSADLRLWKNGNYTVAASISDTESRTMNGGSSNLQISNPAASTSNLSVKAVTPSWNQKTVSVEFSALFSYASSATVFWGTNLKKLSSQNFSIDNGYTNSFNIRSLKPNTVYYFKTTAIGPNGSTTSPTIKLKTPKIPARPRTTYSGGGSGGSGGWTSVVGMRLDKALSALGWSRSRASDAYCPRIAGIVNLDNWYVIRQTSSMLYACKP